MIISKKLLAIPLAAAAAIAAIADEAPAQKEAAGPSPSMFLVGVAKAGVVDHNPVRRYSARVSSPETVAVVAQVAGEVKEVAFAEGALVKKGDLLYRLDDVKYKASVASAKATVEQAKANLDYAQKTYDRTKALFDKKVASADAMDSATSAFASAKSALAAAEAQLVLAEDNLAHCRIVSPVDGKIGVNAATVGNYVSTASGALATIVRQDPVRVVFSPSSRDFLSVYGGEKGLRELFDIRVRLSDGTVCDAPGEVEFVGNQANASTDTMPVFVRFANANGLLVPGASVKVEVKARKPARYVSLPVTAVQHDASGKAYVWMIGENKMPVRRDIVVAATTSSYEAIESGLEEGESVIVRGTHKIVPDLPVEPISLD